MCVWLVFQLNFCFFNIIPFTSSLWHIYTIYMSRSIVTPPFNDQVWLLIFMSTNLIALKTLNPLMTCIKHYSLFSIWSFQIVTTKMETTFFKMELYGNMFWLEFLKCLSEEGSGVVVICWYMPYTRKGLGSHIQTTSFCDGTFGPLGEIMKPTQSQTTLI